jgi:hypothetical protein
MEVDMREWIANKLFDLARWVDWDTVQERCEFAVIASRITVVMQGLEDETEAPAPVKRTVKRTVRRSSVAGARKIAGPKRPRGRPKGSKNKPKS